MPEFGVLKKAELRQLWFKEAFDFTPWIAQNLDSLGAVLGMELELQLQEAPVGPFSLDLLARDLGGDRTVIIENQLEPTDHDHLGKLLTYAAGHDAGIAVWIAPEFREPHRQALDWLNQRTDTHTEFFGVVMEALQIDDSRPAFNFRLVAFPSTWRKQAAGGSAGAPSPKGAAYQAFFQQLIDQLRTQHAFTKSTKAGLSNGAYFSSGGRGVSYGVAFAAGGRVRVEVYFDREDDPGWSKRLFDALGGQRESLETEVGDPLAWERLDDKRASRIAAYRIGNIVNDVQTLEAIRAWAVDRLLRFKTALEPRINSLIASDSSISGLAHEDVGSDEVFAPDNPHAV